MSSAARAARRVWGHADDAAGRTVDVHVAHLREKLGGASPIHTVRGVGYAADARYESLRVRITLVSPCLVAIVRGDPL